MSLMLLVGVWALAFGHITITNNLKMRDNDARFFGIALIAVAAYGLSHLNAFLLGYVPKFILKNATLNSAIELLIGALAIYATGWLMTRGFSKLKIPSINISFKRLRRARVRA